MNSLKIVKEICKLRQWPVFRVHRSMALKVEGKSSSASERTQSDEDRNNEPIQFFGSGAANWRARNTYSGGADEHLSYQPYVISGSLAVFLIYFCVLREENDIDLKLGGELYDHVAGLEQVQLTVNYKYNRKHGLDNTAVIQRLTELGVDVNLIDAKLIAND